MHCFVNFVISMSVTLDTSISSKAVTSLLANSMRKRIRSCPKNIGNSSSDDDIKDIIDPYESKRTTRHHWSSRDISTTDEYDESDLERQVCICISHTFFFLPSCNCRHLSNSQKCTFLTSFCKPVASESFCQKPIIKVNLVKVTNVCMMSIF